MGTQLCDYTGADTMTNNQLYRKMKKLSKLANDMWNLSAEVEQEFINRGIPDSEFRDSGGISIEELEAGSNIAEEIMERFFGEDWKHG